MPRRLLSAAAAGALLLGIAACSDQTDEPVTTAPPSIDVAGPSDDGGDSSPSDGGGSEATEPTAPAPDIPPPDPAASVAMEEHTPEGAEQAFRYDIAVLYWSYQTGSQKELEALQGSTCSECNKLLKEISDIRANGAHWTNVEISTKGSTSAESENYDIEIGYIYTVSEHEERSAATNEVRTIPQDAWTARGGMYWTDDGWIVGGIDISETDREL